MRWVWARVAQGLPAFVIELQDEGPVTFPCLRSGDIFHTVIFPKPTIITEGLQSTFGTESGTAEDNDVGAIHFGRFAENSGR